MVQWLHYSTNFCGYSFQPITKVVTVGKSWRKKCSFRLLKLLEEGRGINLIYVLNKCSRTCTTDSHFQIYGVSPESVSLCLLPSDLSSFRTPPVQRPIGTAQARTCLMISSSFRPQLPAPLTGQMALRY